jgi:hypothetical protein
MRFNQAGYFTFGIARCCYYVTISTPTSPVSLSMSKRKFVTVCNDDIYSHRCENFAKNTRYATSSAENALVTSYNMIPSSSSSSSYEELSAHELNSLLERFYISCRTVDCKDYKAGSFRALRQSLARAIRTSHNYDMLNDPAFQSSNVVFKNRLKHLKRSGLGSTDHYSDIAKEDMVKIIDTLSPADPLQLLLLVWFFLHLHFCRRGQENAETMEKNHFCVQDINGQRCIVQLRDEMTKNHRENDTNRANVAILVEQHGHPKCPVSCFIKYLSKLHPNVPFLWQLPRRLQCTDSTPFWYERKAGRNTISKYEDYQHCVRTIQAVYESLFTSNNLHNPRKNLQ